MDDMWSTLDFTIHDSNRETADSNAAATAMTTVKKEWYTFNIIILHYFILKSRHLFNLERKTIARMIVSYTHFPIWQVTFSTKDSACVGA